MHISIFTSPFVQKGAFVTEAIKSSDRFIAADCGASSALSMGIIPEVVIGDLDSLEQDSAKQLTAKGVKFIKLPTMKDETDTQLAVSYALEQNASTITLIGGIAGNRFEHALANIFLTRNPQVPIFLVNGAGMTWVVSGPQRVTVNGQKNDLLSLIPISPEVSKMITDGLLYPLNDEFLYFGSSRGMSNVFLDDTASVSFDAGMLIITHTNHREI